MRQVLRTIVITGTLVVAVAGCSQVREAVDDALSAALRTAASEALTQAAESKGFALKAEPDCEGGVTTEDASADILCTAETQTGLAVTGRATVTNATDTKSCTGEMTVKIGEQAPFTQKFAGCGG